MLGPSFLIISPMWSAKKKSSLKVTRCELIRQMEVYFYLREVSPVLCSFIFNAGYKFAIMVNWRYVIMVNVCKCRVNVWRYVRYFCTIQNYFWRDQCFLGLWFFFNNLLDIFSKYFLLACSNSNEASLENNEDVILSDYHFDEWAFYKLYFCN